jgi:hypothetical protein
MLIVDNLCAVRLREFDMTLVTLTTARMILFIYRTNNHDVTKLYSAEFSGGEIV